MEQQLYNRYYEGWSRELVRPCSVDSYKELFDRALGSDKPSSDWIVKCLRYGLPFNMGSKAETFCREDFNCNIVAPILELFRDYKVPMIIETKSHYIGLNKYLDILKTMKVAVIVALMGGSDTLNYKLEPGAPHASMRWALVNELNSCGIWTAVRWEPILLGINSKTEMFEDYAEAAIRSKAKHVSFFNYRTSNARIAQVEFENRGYNYIKLLENNTDENWKPVGKTFFNILKSKQVLVSTPDFVNFPFDSDCESCCGVDGLFKPYEFTFQHACKLIAKNGSVSWEDMEAIEFREPEAYQRMKSIWNGEKTQGYYSLKDSPEISVADKKDGMNIYARRDPLKKKGLFE